LSDEGVDRTLQDWETNLKEVIEMTTEVAAVVNGLRVGAIHEMVDAVRAQPQVAAATFSATTTWKTGFNNEATIKAFSLGGARNDTSRQQPFLVPSDHPAELLGTDAGPTSVELLLAALGHCIASGWAVYGAHMGIPFDALRVEVEGDIDLQGMLGLPNPGAVAPGFQRIRATYHVVSNAPREELEQLAKMSEDLSPTRHSLRAVDFVSQLVVGRK
jgi:uncharacterized OsmC-like protein